MSVKDYNVEPELNVSISGISIAEGCAPSGINDALRQLMADVKEESEAQAQAVGEAASEASTQLSSLDSTLRAFIAEEVAKYLPLAGGTLTGVVEFDRADGHICKYDNEGRLVMRGGRSAPEHGASVYLYGIEHPDNPGRLLMQSVTPGGEYFGFDLDKGKATIDGKNVVRIVNGQEADERGIVRTWAEDRAGTNLNTITSDGVYYVSGDNVNIPSGSNGYLVVHCTSADSAIRQVFYRIGTVNSNEHNIYTRARSGSGSWGAWVKMLTDKDTGGAGLLLNSTNVKIYSAASATLPSGGTWAVIGHSSGDGHDANIRGTFAGGTKVSMTDYGGAKFILALKIAA